MWHRTLVRTGRNGVRQFSVGAEQFSVRLTHRWSYRLALAWEEKANDTACLLVFKYCGGHVTIIIRLSWLRKTKSGQAASKMKAPKFEKELTSLLPYIFDEETRKWNISSLSTLSQDEHSNYDTNSHGTFDNIDMAHSNITDTIAP
jgi:uncharacterized protein YkuJ